MKCPECGGDAYVGLNVVECSSVTCRHYRGIRAGYSGTGDLSSLFSAGTGEWIGKNYKFVVNDGVADAVHTQWLGAAKAWVFYGE